MGEPLLPLHGKDVSITWIIGQNPLPDTDNAESVDISENNTQHSDKLLGRVNDRLDETPGHFELNFKKMHVSAAVVNALLANKAKRAANQTPLDVIAMGIKFIARDGSKYAYIASPCTTNINLTVGGKDDAVRETFKIMAEDIKPQAL